MYVTQLIKEDNTLLTWKEVTRKANRNNKGCIPRWFKYNEEKMLHCLTIMRAWGKFYKSFDLGSQTDLLQYDSRITVIDELIEGAAAKQKLINNYFENDLSESKNLKLYTDASCKNHEDGIGCSNIEIYSDNISLINRWKTLIDARNDKWQARRIWNHENISLWKWINEFIKKCNLRISVYKIKSHDGDLYNEMADTLAKEGR
ncbi:hypothetical protein GLOIN_2v1811257 [Rhizophagus clarus]|uniref:RNase H type-1 domain-containing protein n=1 Tax=Rhizophagus clarus TaxID=94130 RepID=A0A8H3M4A0_9GLOM|nr:hypothetical protein GLOIN_2v1811257 [Rhizophagus clarus]